VLLFIQTDQITVGMDRQTILAAYWFLQAGIMNDILSKIVF